MCGAPSNNGYLDSSRQERKLDHRRSFPKRRCSVGSAARFATSLTVS
jgi:hypothetical protein